jgi:hypothetical protein
MLQAHHHNCHPPICSCELQKSLDRPAQSAAPAERCDTIWNETQTRCTLGAGHIGECSFPASAHDDRNTQSLCIKEPLVDARPCMDCGKPNLVWFAPNNIWNQVFPDRVGLVCPNCFIERAERSGLKHAWLLTPETGVEEAHAQEISEMASSLAQLREWARELEDFLRKVQEYDCPKQCDQKKNHHTAFCITTRALLTSSATPPPPGDGE